ncbi:anti-FecI sigma factor FecR [Opitutaceae bacterium TAV5]|nr:anti-FecI sigma factor FecR [Opitutaceae bacterium TAV5]
MNPENDGDEKLAFECLATRYLSGESTSAEREHFVALLADPRWKDLFEDMQLAWDLTRADGTPDFDAAAASRRLATRIAAGEEEGKAGEMDTTPDTVADTGWMDAPEEQVRRNRVWWRLRPGVPVLLAASLALAAGCFLILSRSGLFPGKSATVATTTPARPLHADGTGEAAWERRTTNDRERSLLTLPDGTKVTLNSGSSLDYPPLFGPYARIVRLTGEGYFDVAHDAAKPFIVETSALRITVLGTQFNVRAFADGSKPEVSLVRGKVQVTGVTPAGETAPVVLTPGQQYSFVPESGAGEVQEITPEKITGWMHDEVLFFDREPVASAIRKLETRFGVTVELSDPKLGDETLTGRFEKESLEEILVLLQRTGEIDYRLVRNNGHIKSVVLSPGRNTAGVR